MAMHRSVAAGFAAVLMTAGAAAAADPAAIKEACVKNTSWTAEACECLAGKAKSSSLSSDQQAYVVAILAEDSDGAKKAEAALTVPQFADVSSFLVNAGTDCTGD
ncbi:hypothetical protein [Bauldia litoralis]|uniref:HdeA/HdeB family protein n=1 Tax=Bauldia litoralis TaxID=665467 RepID=A0A1G6A1U8_9HYPH|nr:hypothetical protein [Bauldia litoralis]SDB02404.1 hypothetical protein SAMN02982931_00067 [Bauldia litoralis]